MSHPSRRLPAAVLVLATLLAGCSGGQDESPTPVTTSTPVEDSETVTATASAGPTADEDLAGETVTADSGAFRVRLPADWVDVRAQVEQEVELAVRAGEMSDDFYTNVVVAREEPIADLGPALERAAADIAGEEGGYELLEPVPVGGEEAPGYTFSRTTSGVEIVQTQRWVTHGEHLYVVTLSVAATRAAEGEATLSELFGSWEWLD